MSDAPSTRRARAFVLGLAAVALIESIAAAASYRRTIEDADAESLRQQLARTDADLPMVVDRDWLDPLARMEFEPARRAYGLPDLRDQAEFWVLGRPGDSAWSAEASRRFELEAEPYLVERFDAGGLSLSRLSQGDRALRARDALSPARAMEVRVEGRRCRPKRDAHGEIEASYECRPGRVVWGHVEVDFRARHCLRFEDFDARSVEIQVRDFEFGDALVGHVGFGDFNGRLRSEAAVALELELPGQGQARWVATDAQGWAPFELATQAARGELKIRVRPELSGSFDADARYQRRPDRPVCIELRAVERGGGRR